MTAPDLSKLVNDLLALGVRPGGVLLVHSSLRSLGPLHGGAETVVQGLLEALGPSGTLLMPALSYASVGAQSPFFDVKNTPSCVGALPEYFRTRPGTVRSVHPTHSVCSQGARVEELLGQHHLSTTPCGPESPFARLPGVDGQILFLGCGLRPNTSMHAIEERVIPLYLYGDVIEYRVTFTNGNQRQMQVRCHNFRGWIQRYDRVEGLLASPDLRYGNVLQAHCHLVESAGLWQAVLAKLKEDPIYFVDRARE